MREGNCRTGGVKVAKGRVGSGLGVMAGFALMVSFVLARLRKWRETKEGLERASRGIAEPSAERALRGAWGRSRILDIVDEGSFEKESLSSSISECS